MTDSPFSLPSTDWKGWVVTDVSTRTTALPNTGSSNQARKKKRRKSRKKWWTRKKKTKPFFLPGTRNGNSWLKKHTTFRTLINQIKQSNIPLWSQVTREGFHWGRDGIPPHMNLETLVKYLSFARTPIGKLLKKRRKHR